MQRARLAVPDRQARLADPLPQAEKAGAGAGAPGGGAEGCRIAEERHEEGLEDHSEAARIQELLHALREPYKEVFMWRVYGEKSFRDIGALFGKTENWACVTYHRAKRMIREGLEDD